MAKLNRNVDLDMNAGPSAGWVASGGNSGWGHFAPVDAAEMAYALEFFVACAQGRCHVAASSAEGGIAASLPARENTADTDLLRFLCGADRSSAHAGNPEERTLDWTFRTLCAEYRNRVDKHSICARVLGFYLLMERTGGRAMERWTSECEEDRTTVRIHPAVVRALASIALGQYGVLPVRQFIDLIERLAAEA